MRYCRHGEVGLLLLRRSGVFVASAVFDAFGASGVTSSAATAVVTSSAAAATAAGAVAASYASTPAIFFECSCCFFSFLLH